MKNFKEYFETQFDEELSDVQKNLMATTKSFFRLKELGVSPNILQPFVTTLDQLYNDWEKISNIAKQQVADAQAGR